MNLRIPHRGNFFTRWKTANFGTPCDVWSVLCITGDLPAPNLHKVLRSMSSEPLFPCVLRKVTAFISQILTDVTDDPLVTVNTRSFSKKRMLSSRKICPRHCTAMGSIIAFVFNVRANGWLLSHSVIPYSSDPRLPIQRGPNQMYGSSAIDSYHCTCYSTTETERMITFALSGDHRSIKNEGTGGYCII